MKAYFDKQDRLAPPHPDALPPIAPDKPRTETAQRQP